MNQNIIKFGDTYWIQKNGAAMGTSCAVNYSFLYIGLLEIKSLLIKYREFLIWYGRFIDDGLGMWLTKKLSSIGALENFKSDLNAWGRHLRWTDTGWVNSVKFLDLTISINLSNCLEFKTYRKPMNLNLYLPPHSAHPPDSIRSLIFGRTRAYFLHNTHQKDYVAECTRLSKDLMRRGWMWDSLKPHLTEADTTL